MKLTLQNAYRFFFISIFVIIIAPHNLFAGVWVEGNPSGTIEVTNLSPAVQCLNPTTSYASHRYYRHFNTNSCPNGTKAYCSSGILEGYISFTNWNNQGDNRICYGVTSSSTPTTSWAKVCIGANSITCQPYNSSPIIQSTPGPTSATLTENGSSLITTGSMTVTDANSSDTVTVSVKSLSSSGISTIELNNQGLSNTALKNMLSLTPTTVISSGQTSGTFNWNFNSGSENFDFINYGQTLTLTYVIEAKDNSNATITSNVTVTISGKDCQSSSECNNPTPICTTNGECVGCSTSSNNCASGLDCSTSGSCVECISDTKCLSDYANQSKPQCLSDNTCGCDASNDCVSTSLGKCDLTSNICVPCTSNQDCSIFPNTSVCNTGNGQCVDCTTNSDCSGSEVCSGNTCVSGNCLTDSDCSLVDPVCSNNNCTDCSSDSDCSRFTDEKVCDTSNGQCVICSASSDCASGEVCSGNTCVTGNCLSDSDCSASDPVCLNNTCSDCTSDADCTSFPNLSICNTTSGECIACLNDSDCGAGNFCSNNTCVSGNCLTNADCESSDPVCLNNNCSDCSSDSDCSRFVDENVCNTVNGECTECNDNADCKSNEVCANNECIAGNCLTNDDCGIKLPVCTNYNCTDCSSNADCTRFTDTPSCDTYSGRCVACNNNADCGSNEVCSDSLCVAGDCLTDSDCSFDNPVCSNFSCSNCVVDCDCVSYSNTPACNSSTGQCVACNTSLDCSSNEICSDNKCTSGNCTDDSGCSASAPVCSNFNCTDCSVDSDCSRFTNTNVCDASNGQCVDCVDSSDCNSNEICSNNICANGNCLTDTDCNAGNPVCSNFNCTDCSIDSDCSRFTDTKSCNTNNGQCVGCMDNNDCNSNQVCSNNTCTSGNCLTDNDCDSDNPVCLNYNCTDCSSDGDCSRFTDTKSCNTNNGQCVGCMDNADCNSNQVCSNNTCTSGNCLTDNDCDSDNPVCLNYNCTDCSSDGDCSRFTDTKSCNTNNGQCVGCMDNADCSSNQVCSNNACVTGNCLVDSDCEQNSTCVNNECSYQGCADENDCAANQMCLMGGCVDVAYNGKQNQCNFGFGKKYTVPVLTEKYGLKAKLSELNYNLFRYCTDNHKTACKFCEKLTAYSNKNYGELINCIYAGFNIINPELGITTNCTESSSIAKFVDRIKSSNAIDDYVICGDEVPAQLKQNCDLLDKFVD